MKVTETANVLLAANKDAAVDSSKIIAGNIINERLVKVVTPRLPIMVRGYADTPLGKAAMANLFAGIIIHMLPENQKALIAAECMIQSASLELASNFNIEEIINELLDNVPGLDAIEKSNKEPTEA